MSTSRKVTTLVDTATNWTFANDILPSNYLGLESDTGFMKLGDGVTHWSSLDYVGAEVAEGSGVENFIPKFDADGNLVDSLLESSDAGVVGIYTSDSTRRFRFNTVARSFDINFSDANATNIFDITLEFGINYYNFDSFSSKYTGFAQIGVGAMEVYGDNTIDSYSDLHTFFSSYAVGDSLAQIDTASNANQSSLLVEHNGVLKRLKFETAAGGKRTVYIDE